MLPIWTDFDAFWWYRCKCSESVRYLYVHCLKPARVSFTVSDTSYATFLARFLPVLTFMSVPERHLQDPENVKNIMFLLQKHKFNVIKPASKCQNQALRALPCFCGVCSTSCIVCAHYAAEMLHFAVCTLLLLWISIFSIYSLTTKL